MQQSSDAGLQVCLAARARRGRAPPWNLTGQGCLAARLAQSGQHPSGGSQSHRVSRGGGKGTCRSTPYPTPGAVSAQPSSAQSARHCSGTLHTGRAQARVKGAPRRTFSALADGMPPLRGGGRERWRLLQVCGRVDSLGGPKAVDLEEPRSNPPLPDSVTPDSIRGSGRRVIITGCSCLCSLIRSGHVRMTCLPPAASRSCTNVQPALAAECRDFWHVLLPAYLLQHPIPSTHAPYLGSPYALIPPDMHRQARPGGTTPIAMQGTTPKAGPWSYTVRRRARPPVTEVTTSA